MKLLGMALLLISGSAFAGTNGYDLQMDFSLNGKHIFSPRVLVKEGELATVTQKMENQESFVEVSAKEGSMADHKGILMTFTLGIIGKNGERTIVGRPQILAKENEPAQITVQDDNASSEQLSLSVTAKRTDL